MRRAHILAGLLAGAVLPAVPAVAQTSAPVAALAPTDAEIIVTARKREESLTDIPVAVTAFSDAAIAARGVTDLQELARFAPGLSVANQGATFGGRLLSGIRFRGMNPSVFTPSTQVGSLFIDGVYYLGGAQSVGFDDVERVEVIRGPQAAYFGRATFGGAINFITRDPGVTFAGKAEAEYSPSFDGWAVAGAFEGPIAGDTLRARITGSIREEGAQYTATDGTELGRERTSTIAGTLLFEPNDRLRIKGRASYSVDDDGPPAFTTVSYSRVGSCPRGTVLPYLDASFNRRSGPLSVNFHCGGLPFDGLRVTQNGQFPAAPFPPALTPGAPGTPAQNIPLDVREVLAENSFGSDLLGDAPDLDRIGLIRKTQRYSLLFDWQISDRLSLGGNAAYNLQKGNSIRDADNSDAQTTYIAAPFIFDDRSFETRLAWDGGALRALVGVNSYRQKTRQAFTNAVEATCCFSIPTGSPFTRPNPLQNPTQNDRIKTIGVFGSVDWDIREWLTLTAEARYQSDTVTRFSGSELIGLTQEPDVVSKEFLPRFILSVRPIEDLTIYAQYAEGTLPGDNTNLAVFRTLTPGQVEEVTEILGDVAEEIPAERLRSYEFGLKHAALDGRVRFALTGYYMEWENQKAQVSIFLTSGLGRTVSFRVPGESEIKGVEFEVAASPVRQLLLEGSFAYTDSRYVDFNVASNAAFFGGTAVTGWNARGNIQPRFPDIMATGSATWTDRLSDSWDWSLRGDVIHTGRTFVDELNLAWVDPYTTVNARLGFIRGDRLRLEVYADNLFDAGGWASGAGNVDLSLSQIVTLPLQRGASVTPIDRRTVGFRATFGF